MISTYDLTLLGSLVTAGGLAFLRQGKWPHLNVHWRSGSKRTIELSAEHRDEHARSTALAGARWLTVGALTLFIAYVHGAKEGYLFGPWTDVMFHLLFVSTCWATTVYRINQVANRSTALSLDRQLERLRQHQLDFLYGRDDTSGVLLYAAAQDKDDIPA